MGLCHSLCNLNPSLHLTILIPANRATAAAVERKQYPPIKNPERVRYIHYGTDIQKREGMYGQRGGYRNECIQWLAPFEEPLLKVRQTTGHSGNVLG